MTHFVKVTSHSAAAILLSLLVWGCGGRGEAEAPPESVAAEVSAAETSVVLDSVAMAVAGIRVALVDTATSTELLATGTITYDGNRVSHIGPRTTGRIVTMLVDLGSQVGAGQPLAILESPEVGQIRAEEHEAEALVRIEGENYERERRLEAQGISSRKELLESEAALRRAEAALLGARERLQALGSGEGQGGQFTLAAPFPGVVVERDASLGEMVDPEDRLFTVASLDRLWMELDIYEKDLARVRRGQTVDVITAAFPAQVFSGTVTYVGQIVDPEKRTVRTRVEIPNSGRALRPGMFATARVRVAGAGTLVVVPQDAVQQMDGRPVVFVPGDRPGEFRIQVVEVGLPDSEGRIAVLSGLSPGDRVVVSGAFALRSELAKGEFAEEEG